MNHVFGSSLSLKIVFRIKEKGIDSFPKPFNSIKSNTCILRGVQTQTSHQHCLI